MVTDTESRPNGLAGIVRGARSSFEELTGRRVESVSSVGSEGGEIHMTFEVVELERIPDSTSLLGSYEVSADDDGNLLEYNRVRRYYRNRADEEY